ncbi:hypothetical protein LLG46_01960 [bacterium]|nr:hypothetical protein [bacterium]
MRMITALNEDTNLVQDVTTTGDGRLRVEVTSRYAGMRSLVDGNEGGNGYTIAAGAYTTPVVITDLAWTRYALYFYKSNSTGTLYLSRIDDEGNVSEVEGTISNVFSVASGYWRDMLTTSPILCSESIQLRIKNTGSSAGDYWLKIAFFG